MSGTNWMNFINQLGAVVDAPAPLPEAGELASSHLDSELAVGLWASHVQGGRPSETVFGLILFSQEWPSVFFYEYSVCAFCHLIQISL